MQAAMDFLKNYWISLVSGLVAVVGLTFAILFMLDDSVTAEMGQRVSAANQIQSLQRDPKNQAAIEAEKARTQAYEAEYERTLETAREINKREPLLAGVFPSAQGSTELKFRFQELYREKLYELPRNLRAGGPPTEHEIVEEIERMVEEKRRRVEAGIVEEDDDDRGGGGLPPAGRRPPRNRPGGLGGAPGGLGGPPPGMGGPPGSFGGPPPGMGGTGGVPTPDLGDMAKDIDKEEAFQRAAVRKAQNIRVYAQVNLQQGDSSFHISPIVTRELAPQVTEMWYAQVGLWIQRDIVNAVREVNEAAARRLQPAEDHVGNMPVKRIVRVNVDGYVPAAGGLVPFDKYTPASGGREELGVAPSFTARKSDAQFDVVRFTVQLVADQRDLLKIANAMTTQNLYQLVDLDYDAVDAADVEAGFFYGSEPVVFATFSFEGYFARNVFGEKMPQEVAQLLSASSPGG